MKKPQKCMNQCDQNRHDIQLYQNEAGKKLQQLTILVQKFHQKNKQIIESITVQKNVNTYQYSLQNNKQQSFIQQKDIKNQNNSIQLQHKNIYQQKDKISNQNNSKMLFTNNYDQGIILHIEILKQKLILLQQLSNIEQEQENRQLCLKMIQQIKYKISQLKTQINEQSKQQQKQYKNQKKQQTNLTQSINTQQQDSHYRLKQVENSIQSNKEIYKSLNSQCYEKQALMNQLKWEQKKHIHQQLLSSNESNFISIQQIITHIASYIIENPSKAKSDWQEVLQDVNDFIIYKLNLSTSPIISLPYSTLSNISQLINKFITTLISNNPKQQTNTNNLKDQFIQNCLNIIKLNNQYKKKQYQPQKLSQAQEQQHQDKYEQKQKWMKQEQKWITQILYDLSIPQKQQIFKYQQSKQSDKYLPKQLSIIKQFQNKSLVTTQSINYSQDQIQIQVRILTTQVNHEYQLKIKSKQRVINKNLLQSIKSYVYFYLQHNQINVINHKPKIPIIQDTLYQKSNEFGNYQFDPFCQSIQFFVMKKNNNNFTKSFNVKGKPQIKFTFITDQTIWNKNSHLIPTDQIEKLIQFLCNKKQQTQQTCKQAIQKFKNQSVKLIRDLYEWQKHDYQRLQIRITWIYQINQIVNRIKDRITQNKDQNKSFELEKQQCIKIANSHKILRYVVYKVQGEKQLNLLPKINCSNLKKAVQIVKKKVINDQLLQKLQSYFYQFTHIPQENQRISLSQGLILYGPPGTGKSQLTQALPNIIGFHLISCGLSAADFMKSFGGESSRMIKQLASRATLSPHLLCSVGIDEVDGLVPDRKDKDQKNKGQNISMLLSVIGGNKNIPNLLYFTSTKYLKKIDQAIRRRLSGQFQVGRPNPEARRKILKQVSFLNENEDHLNHLERLTANFTGAALQRLKTVLILKRNKNIQQRKQIQLTNQEVTDGTIKTAKQFNITLGAYSFPQIQKDKANKKYMFSLKFLKKIANGFLLINQKSSSEYQMSYANKIQKYFEQQDHKWLQNQYESFSDFLKIQSPKYDKGFDNFLHQLKKSLKTLKCAIKVAFKSQQALEILNFKQFNQPYILIIKDSDEKTMGDILFHLIEQTFQQQIQNLFIVYYVDGLNTQESTIFEILSWKKSSQKNYPYSGRIMVELNEQPRMAFELNTPQQDQTKFSFRYFLKSQKQNCLNDVLPELVQFFNERQVSYILLIDYQLILQNDAHDEQKMKQVIEQKMSEAFNYDKVAVIINLDSLIIMNKNSSDSSMGRSTSYSLADLNMYRFLLNYMNTFPMMVKNEQIKQNLNQTINQTYLNLNQTIRPSTVRKPIKYQPKINYKKQKWITIIVKNPELAKLVKQDLTWPTTPQEINQMRQQQQMKRQKTCGRCNNIYTEEDNRKQKKCSQHPGPLIDLQRKKIETNYTIQQAKLLELNYKKLMSQKKEKNSSQDLFIYACCIKGLSEAGQGVYYHIEQKDKQTKNDQLFIQRKRRNNQWQKVVQSLNKFC